MTVGLSVHLIFIYCFGYSMSSFLLETEDLLFWEDFCIVVFDDFLPFVFSLLSFRGMLDILV